MSQHTKGPWRAYRNAPTGAWYVKDGDGPVEIAHTVAMVQSDHASADAHLIAQAPAMLEALRDLLAWINAHDADDAGALTLADRRYSEEGNNSVDDARAILRAVEDCDGT